MLSLVGVGCKEYRQWMGSGVPEVSCPSAGCDGVRLRGHGSYRRYVGGQYVAIRRLRCVRCRVSHALLPDDLCVYRDVTLAAMEAVLAAGTPSVAARTAGQRDGGGVRRVRRWIRQAGGRWVDALLALLPAVCGPWWRRAQAVVGEPPGWLGRLRRWLWSQWRCYLGGGGGLYRRGRPERRRAARSP